MTRLIKHVPALQQLLAAVAAIPAGQKLNIPDLRDALLNQADVLDGLTMLIALGEIDCNTLRPPPPGQMNPLEQDLIELGHPPEAVVAKVEAKQSAPPAPPASPRPTGTELARQLEEAGAARGLKTIEISRQIFGNPTSLYCLRAGPKPVMRKTLEKALAWLALGAPERTSSPAAAPPDCGPSEEGCAALAEGPPAIDEAIDLPMRGKELADQLIAEGERRGLKPSPVSRAVFGNNSQLFDMRRNDRPVRDRVLAKARAWLDGTLANLVEPAPQPAPSKPLNGTKPTRPPAQRRDPTQPPAHAVEDLADRQHRRAGQHGAAARRSIERQAQAAIAAGISPAKAGNQAVRGAMNEIERRRESEARLADPFETAKLKLQRSRVVHCASVTGGCADKFIVSGCNREVTRPEIIALAAGELTVNRINEGARA